MCFSLFDIYSSIVVNFSVIRSIMESVLILNHTTSFWYIVYVWCAFKCMSVQPWWIQMKCLDLNHLVCTYYPLYGQVISCIQYVCLVYDRRVTSNDKTTGALSELKIYKSNREYSIFKKSKGYHNYLLVVDI